MGLCCFGSLGFPVIKLFLSSSSFGGATQVTGSLITPQVRRIGPEGLKGLLLRGLTKGKGLGKSIFFVGFLSLALLR